MGRMSFGPDSSDADAIYLSAFEQFGRCLERDHLVDGEGGLHDEFLAEWLRRAEHAGWIGRDGDRLCITAEGERRYSDVKRELAISNDISIGLPVRPRRSQQLWRGSRSRVRPWSTIGRRH